MFTEILIGSKLESGFRLTEFSWFSFCVPWIRNSLPKNLPKSFPMVFRSLTIIGIEAQIVCRFGYKCKSYVTQGNRQENVYTIIKIFLK